MITFVIKTLRLRDLLTLELLLISDLLVLIDLGQHEHLLLSAHFRLFNLFMIIVVFSFTIAIRIDVLIDYLVLLLLVDEITELLEITATFFKFIEFPDILFDLVTIGNMLA